MNTTFYTYLVDQKCPACKTEQTCELRKYIKKEPLFKMKMRTVKVMDKGNETIEKQYILKPTKDLFFLSNREYSLAIAEINDICARCQRENTK